MTPDSHRTSTDRIAVTATVAAVVVVALVLLWMGRVAICKCGYVKLWHGVVFSPENSQHLTDWYTFSHIIHGFLFYGALWLIASKWPWSVRLLLATMIEGAWEIFENSPVIIDRYRAVTNSLDYYGDSVLNSVSDIVSMIAGFIIASRAPVVVVVALGLAMEAIAGVIIRDNLALNILMLIWPMEWLKAWQAGG